MGKFLLVTVAITLFVYALFDLAATPADRVRYLPKPLWLLVVVLPIVGPVLWLLAGTQRWAPGGGRTSPPRAPRPGPKGPDDDPDYLRGL